MGWDYLPVFAPVAGLRYDKPAPFLENEHTPKCSNVRFRLGYVEKAKGAPTWANTTNTALDGTCMLFGQIISDNSTTYNYGITIDKFYELGRTGTVTNRTASALTGDIDDTFLTVVFNDALIVTNGKDDIRTYSGGGNEADLSGIAGTYAQAVQSFGGRLCIYNTIESGVTYPQRLRWSDVDDATSWTAANYKDMDFELKDGDAIVRAEPLGNSIIIYGSDSIAMQDYREDTSSPFPTSERCGSVGLAAPRALINLDGCEHIFLGKEDIYSYKGGRTAEPLGQHIKSDLFDNINRQYIRRSFMTYNAEFDTIRLYICSGSETVPQTYYDLNLSSGCLSPPCKMAWSKGATPAFSGTGKMEDATTGKIYTVLGRSNGEVYRSLESSLNWGTGPIDGYFDTKDFTTDAQYRRTLTNWMSMTFEGLGDAVDLYYSVDGGLSYTAVPGTTVNMSTSTWHMFTKDFEVNHNQCRFRFRNDVTSQQFKVRHYELAYIDASDRGVD